MDDALGRARRNLRVQRAGRIGLLPLARNLGVLVFVLGVAGRTPRLLHIGADHRNDCVVRHAAFARTIIVQNVTKPKLALLHQISRRTAGWEWGCRKAVVILAQQ